MSDDKKGSTVLGVAGAALKADTAMVTTASDNFPADSFEGLYYSQGEGTAPTVAIIEPQYKPHVLHALSTQNNTLRQCIEAMEVNIDGTGHSIEAVDTDVEDEKEKAILESFFNEPYPNKTMVELRRAIRVDVEETGMGYMEVCRDGLDEIVMLNHIPSANMRLLRYDEPVMVSKSLKRGDSVIEVKVRTRERRFVQRINGTNTFFKEFGASRDLDRKTGAWAVQEKGKLRLDITQRASEIIVFGGVPEAKTPYCSPRWINQLPSVLGSRKAEEFNLEYFDAGGVPPAIILVQGGYLGETVKQDLERKLSSKAQNSRVVVLEAISASGSLDSSGTVSVRVERFGSERQNDSMFQNYDKNCEEHVRVGFRLPPMFIGRAQDYNFATAVTAYMVAEAQVFLPEREEFDSKINNTIVKALGVTKYKFRSLPLTLVDSDKQLKALAMVQGTAISGEELVKRLNEITGLNMQYEKQETPVPPAQGNQFGGTTTLPQQDQSAQTNKAKGPVADQSEQDLNQAEVDLLKQKAKTTKSETLGYILALATQWIGAVGLDGAPDSSVDLVALKREINSLGEEDSEAFHGAITALTMKKASSSLDGLKELCGCAAHME